MISTGAFLDEMDASNKQNTKAKKFAAVWEKKNAKAARAGGVSLMALSLAACGGSSDTTTSNDSSSSDDASTTVVNTNSALTSGLDTLVGGAGADTYSASNTTLNAGDSITGGAGDDKLAIFTSGSTATNMGGFSTDGVETISVSASGAAATVNLGNVAGETGLQVTGSSQNVTFTNTNNIVPVELSYNSAGNVTVTYNSSTVAGTADVGTIDLIDTTNGTITMAGVETLNVSNSGTSAITTVTAAAATTVNISGSGKLTTDIADTATTVDMSGMTGTTITTGYGTGAITITGGSGADTVTLGTSLTGTNGDVVDLGDGEDTLKLSFTGNAAVTSTTAGDVSVSNVETLHLTTAANSDAIDFDVFSDPAGFTTVHVVSQLAAADVTLTDVQSNDFILTNTNGGTTAHDVDFLTIDLKDSTSATDAITVKLENKDVDESMTLATLTAAGVETISIEADATTVAGTPGDTIISTLTATSMKTLNISGDADLTISSNLPTSLTTVSAAAATGDVDLTFAGANTTVTGGAGADTFTYGTSFNDDDTVDGGAGTDILEITGAGSSLNVNATAIETLNVTTGGADTYDLNDIASLTTLNVIFGAAGGHDATFNNIAAGTTTLIIDGAATLTATVTFDLDNDTSADAATIRIDLDGTGYGGDITANDYETLTIDLDFTGAGALTAADVDDFDALSATDATSVTLKTSDIESWSNGYAEFGTANFASSVTLDLQSFGLNLGTDGSLGISDALTQAQVGTKLSAASFGSAGFGDGEGIGLTAADSVTIILDDGASADGADEFFIDLDASIGNGLSGKGGAYTDTNVDTIKFNDDGSTTNDIGMVIISNFQDRTNYSATSADVIDLSALGVTGLSELSFGECDDKDGTKGTSIFSVDGSDSDSVGDRFAGFIVLLGVESTSLTADNFIFA